MRAGSDEGAWSIKRRLKSGGRNDYRSDFTTDVEKACQPLEWSISHIEHPLSDNSDNRANVEKNDAR